RRGALALAAARSALGQPVWIARRRAAASRAAGARGAAFGVALPLWPGGAAPAPGCRAAGDSAGRAFPRRRHLVEPPGALLPMEPAAEFEALRGSRLCWGAPAAKFDPARHAAGAGSLDSVRRAHR